MHNLLLLMGLSLVCLPSYVRAIEPFPYTLQWKRLIGDPLRGAVAFGDSAVFVGGVDGRLLAVQRSDGTRFWQRRGYGPIRRMPAAIDAELIFADAWGRLVSLEAGYGEVRWEAQRLGWGDAEVAVGESVIYASSADGWLYALRRADGSEIWRARIGTRAVSRPCMDGDRLYVGTRDGRVLGLAMATGARLGQVEMGGRAVAGPIVVEGRLVVAGTDGYVRAYGRGNLDSKWTRRLGAQLIGEPLVLDGLLIGAVDNGWAYGLRAGDGEVVWKRVLGGTPQGRPVRGPRGELLIGLEDGRLLAFATGTGEPLWEVQLLENGGVRPHCAGERLYVSAGDGYLYAFAPPSRLRGEEGALWEDWWEVFSSGQKTGYRHRVAQEIRLGGERGLRLVEERVGWRGGFSRSLDEVWVDRDFRPLAFSQRRIEGSQVIEVEGVWEGDSLRFEQRLAGHAISRRLAVGREVVLPQVLLLRLQREGRLVAGRRDSVRVFDYASLEPRWLHFSCVAGEESLLEVHLRDAEPVLAELERRVDIDAEGREVEEWVPLLEVGQVRVDEVRARAWVPPGVGKRLWLDYPVIDPAAVEEMVLGLPADLGDPHLFMVEDDRQRLEMEAGGGARLTIRRVAYDGADAVELPIRDPALAPYLGSSLYIQAGDERIRALASRLREGERNAWKVADRLRQWVYDHMIPRHTNVRFKSSLEVLEDMEGTCSEHAVLYMALCRAAGLPARACVGFLVAQTGELVLHIWTQVYVGRWIDVDPSWEGSAVSAAHIKTGQGRLIEEELQRLELPLQLFMVRADSLELRGYQMEEGRFVRAAEVLYEEARKAERNFLDERSQELYHQLTLLPWNQRSGEAYVSIARYRLRREELDEAEWACRRILLLDGEGETADQALYYLSRVAEERGQMKAAIEHLERLVALFPDHDLADDALCHLGELHEKTRGCDAATPYYVWVREEYHQSGWAEVARVALERCRRRAQEKESAGVKVD